MAAEEEAAYVMYRRGGLGLMPIFQYPASDAVRGGLLLSECERDGERRICRRGRTAGFT